VKLPADLAAYVIGRSTWGRLGLIVATAIGVHPGFAGCITCELRNLGETPLVLYPGQTIGQLFLHSVVDHAGAPETERAQDAQYSGTVDIAPQRISSKSTRKTINNLIKKFEKMSGT
jgi:dCTP deaminase